MKDLDFVLLLVLKGLVSFFLLRFLSFGEVLSIIIVENRITIIIFI